MTEQRLSKSDLLKELQVEHDKIESMLNELSSEKMEIPGAQGNWSVKDIIAHITHWEHSGTKWISSIAQGKEPQVPFSDLPFEEMVKAHDKLNFEIYQNNRNRSVQSILNEFHQAFPLLVKQVERLTVDQLEKTFKFAWADNPIPVWKIVRWRSGHYQSHGKHIRAWLEKKVVKME